MNLTLCDPNDHESPDHQPMMPSPEGQCLCRRCGVPIKWSPRRDGYVLDTPPKPPDEAAVLLLEIAAAAKAWNRSADKGTKRLKKAVKAWIAIGG